MSTFERSFDTRSHVADAVFERVLVCVDGTPPGFEACRQAARLAGPDAAVEAVCVVHLSDAIQVGLGEAAGVQDALRDEAARALAEARELLGPGAETKFVNGFATQALLREADEFGATVLAAGSHGHRRATEILVGGVVGELLHSAPGSVLVARAPRAHAFPDRIVAGVDGSDESLVALAVADGLARRFAVRLDAIVATGGEIVDSRHVPRSAHAADEHPVTALVEASRTAGLLVVGSRGLHGLRALGSVSERVAHQAESSVLVVRGVGRT